MEHFDDQHHQASALAVCSSPVMAYPPPKGHVYPPSAQPYQQPAGCTHGSYIAPPPPPPPVGYPTKDGSELPQQNHLVENKSRGDDFWKGCFAALCCCCVLDFCCC